MNHRSIRTLVRQASEAARDADTLTGLNLRVNLFDAAKRSDSFSRVGWSDELIVRAIQRYGQFLQLVGKIRAGLGASKSTPISPTWEIDEIWHLHMLSPVAYFKDCMDHLGFLLDHDGGFGKVENEVESLKHAYFNTEAEWHKAFNESYAAPEFTSLRIQALGDVQDAHNCWHDCQDRCWHACSNGVNSELFAMSSNS